MPGHGAGRRALLLAAAALPIAARAEEYPSRPVRIVVPHTPGGAIDALMRVLSERLGAAWRQPVIIENRPGAGTNIGVEAVIRSAPDGYTLLATANAVAINPAIYPRLPFDPVRDLVPVARLGAAPYVVAVHPSLPARDMAALAAHARATPGRLNYASAGVGSPQHMAGELFNWMAGTEIVHVAYRGAPEMMAALLADQVQVAFASVTTALPLAREGRLRLLATTGPSRVPSLPELPTVAESGWPGYEVDPWLALFAPAGTPEGVAALVSRAAGRVLADEALREDLSRRGVEVGYLPGERFAPAFRAEVARWSELARRARIAAE